MKKRKAEPVPVEYGKLLENQLKKWQGGGRHMGGIAEYISNCDDSYRRLKKFHSQRIDVEIQSKRGRHIDKLTIKDNAEGMSYIDLEKKFFRYFESASGREQGEQVSGRFGTGGKAYGIMNFERCWIISVKDGVESKAWFKWDSKNRIIVKGYNSGGYSDKKVNKPNGTTVELYDSLKVNHELMEIVAGLEKLPRIRQAIKDQEVYVKLRKKKEDETFPLKYLEPQNAIRSWEFPVPKALSPDSSKRKLILRYFERPLGDHAFIDVSDGISSVADLKVASYDGRPFSRYFNGSITLELLKNSSAVKENRKGLEEGDDLTDMIESFVKECVVQVVNEVEEEQRKKEKERRKNFSNEKMKELSRFLKKCDLKFKFELKELKKRAINTVVLSPEVDEEIEEIEIYRRPTKDDPPEVLVRGSWITHSGNKGEEGQGSNGVPIFMPDAEGIEFGVRVGARPTRQTEGKKKREGIQVVLSDDPNFPDSDRPVFSEYDDPVSDRDMEKGIIWINANHPLIAKMREKSDNDPVFLEMVANYTLMIVAQVQAQKHYDAEPEDQKSEPLLLFRERFFRLQRDLRDDGDIAYFESESEPANTELKLSEAAMAQ